MTNLSELNQYYKTVDATAVAADIRSGKVAYGPDGKVVGNLVQSVVYPLINPGAEEVLTTGWTSTAGLYAQNSSSPHSGTYMFYPGNAAYSSIYQDLVAAAGGITEADIDAGNLIVLGEWWQRTFAGSDHFALEFQFYDGAMALISNNISPSLAGSTSWYARSFLSLVPPLTRTIRVVLRATRASGTSNDGYTDDFVITGVIK